MVRIRRLSPGHVPSSEEDRPDDCSDRKEREQRRGPQHRPQVQAGRYAHGLPVAIERIRSKEGRPDQEEQRQHPRNNKSLKHSKPPLS